MLKPTVGIFRWFRSWHFRCFCSWTWWSWLSSLCNIFVCPWGVAFPLLSCIWLLAEGIISLLGSLYSAGTTEYWWKTWSTWVSFNFFSFTVFAGSIFLRQPQVLIDTVNLLGTAEPDWEALVFSLNSSSFSDVAAFWYFEIVAKSSVLWVVIALVVGSGLVVITNISPGFSEALGRSENFISEGIRAFDALLSFPLPETINNWD